MPNVIKMQQKTEGIFAIELKLYFGASLYWEFSSLQLEVLHLHSFFIRTR